jgi:hypothetical protein
VNRDAAALSRSCRFGQTFAVPCFGNAAEIRPSVRLRESPNQGSRESRTGPITGRTNGTVHPHTRCRPKNIFKKSADFQKVEWRGGVSPPRSPRTGRERLRSSGSYHPIALRHDPNLPMGKQTTVPPRIATQTPRGLPHLGPVSLVFVLCPANQPHVQTAEGPP